MVEYKKRRSRKLSKKRKNPSVKKKSKSSRRNRRSSRRSRRSSRRSRRSSRRNRRRKSFGSFWSKYSSKKYEVVDADWGEALIRKIDDGTEKTVPMKKLDEVLKKEASRIQFVKSRERRDGR